MKLNSLIYYNLKRLGDQSNNYQTQALFSAPCLQFNYVWTNKQKIKVETNLKVKFI